MSLMQLSRSRISPKRVTAALLCSRRMFAAGAQSSASPGDAFAAQLQSKTERELLELLERRNQPANQAPEAAESQAKGTEAQGTTLPERGGPRGPEPTRFGDWEQKGRCSDF